MGDINWVVKVSVSVAVLGLAWTVVRYLIERHSKAIYHAIKNNKEDAMQRFSQLEHEQKSNEKLILETRDDLHMNYVRNEDLDKSISEFKHLIGKAIDQITSISRDLNQLIGEISVHRRKDDKSQ